MRSGCAVIVALAMVLAPLAAPGPAGAEDYPLRFNDRQIHGPQRGADSAPWLAAMRDWRTAERARISYDPAAYERPELAWARSNPIQPQVMAEDRYLYDPVKRRYTVDRYLADVRRRYGGVDSVLIWPTYPNIGTDDRNTEDMLRAMPGGLPGVTRMIKDFHKSGVRVLFPIMVWDLGTRDPGATWAEILPRLMAAVGADGLNGDTMNAVTKDYDDNALKIGHPLVLEPELGMAGDRRSLQWNVQSWGYFDYTSYVPMVSISKWMEPRHTVHVNDRWSKSKIDMLQSAFFNGTGLESWENIWGIWNGLTDRDGEAIRRVATIERAFPEALVSQGWEPHTPTRQNDKVFASKWPDGGRTLWTMVNRSGTGTTGDQLTVPHRAGTRYYDLWHGTELTPEIDGAEATLSFPIEAKGFGAVLAAAPKDLPAGLGKLLATARGWADRPLSSYPATGTVLQQTMTPIKNTRRHERAPEGTVYVPGANYRFNVRGTEIEGGNMPGVDVQYPWEKQPGRHHTRTIPIRPFYMDRTPVTNAQFQRFLRATGYRPADDHNFLKDWDHSDPRRPAYRKGHGGKPVTWVSIEDARAYAAWAGRRLPNEWEWQYAAQGLDGRNYPWGNAWNPSRVSRTFDGRGTPPPLDDAGAHPQGAGPFGTLDMVGSVWQWTNEFTDDHTRGAVLRGGSNYRATGSHWYFPSDQNAYRLDHHNKYLMMSPGKDRARTIGFRTVADATPSAAPAPADDGTVVDDAAPGWRVRGWGRYNDGDAYQDGGTGGRGGTDQSAEYDFTGTGVDVYGWRGVDGGTVRVLVDGRPVGEPVNLRAGTPGYHHLLARVGGLPDGRHTVRVENTAATRGDQWTMVDYLRVYGSGDRQPAAPPRIQVTDRMVTPGATVPVTVSFRNESAAPVSGRLALTGASGVPVAPAGQEFSGLAPHDTVTARFEVTVPADAAPGGTLLKAVATLAGRPAAESWSGLAVLGAVDPVVATPSRGGAIDLAFQPVDPEGESTYEIHASTTKGFTPGPDTRVGTTKTTTFTHRNLRPEQTWYYRVRAVGGTAAGPYSREVAATTSRLLVIEAESLVPLPEATAPYVIQDDCCGVRWSGGRQIWFQAAGKGDRYTLEFTVPKAGAYDLSLIYTKAADFGRQTRTLDGRPLGEEYDHFNVSGVALDRRAYGPISLAAGKHSLTFTITGKNEESPRHGFGLDGIELDPS